MDDDKPGDQMDETSALPGANRKRPGPTIELKATDVSDVSGLPQADGVTGGETSQSPGVRSRRMSGLFSHFASLLGPAITGAVAAALVAGGIVFFAARSGEVPVSSSSDSALIDALRVRIAALESRGVSSGQTASVQSADTGSALTAKIGWIDEALASLRESVRKLRAQNDDTAASINALKSAAQQSPAAPDMSVIEERLAKLERATVALTADASAASTSTASADPTVPRVAAAALLDQIVRQGEPFEAALGNARKFGDRGALKALEPFAAAGVPTAAALCGDLLTLLPQLELNADPVPAASGIWQRLQQSASRLVRIRRTDDAQDADVLSSVKDAAQREDVDEARRLLMTLPDAQRSTVQQWIDKADARDAALAASRRYAQDAMSVMPRPSGDSR
jgi:hypothetical protein